jgi:hypothetical protein
MSGVERKVSLSEINNLLIAAYRQGIPLKNIDLLQIPYRELKNSLLRGKRSEIRAKVLISTLSFVEKVTWSTQREDMHEQIDLWVCFAEWSDHERIPVQVKSRQPNVTEFLRGIEGDRRIIGLNAGPDNTNYGVKKDFIEQLFALDGFL